MLIRQTVLGSVQLSVALAIALAAVALEGRSQPLSDNKRPSHSESCSCRHLLSDAGTAPLSIQNEPSVSATPPVAGSASSADDQSSVFFLEDLNLRYVSQDWGDCHKAKSVDGAPLKLDGQAHEHGIGTHAQSEFFVDLKGQASKFEALVGVDDEVSKRGSVAFEVFADDKKLFDSGILHGGDKPQQVAVDLKGARRLLLIVGDGNGDIDFDHADWADARISMAPGTAERPAATTAEDKPPPQVAQADNSTAAIHGPPVIGTTPGRPFIYLIPATGKGQLTFAAENLPEGLQLNAKTGIISGSVSKPGLFTVKLNVQAENGAARSKILINAGKGKLALTPPMGWNSWNCWGGKVDSKKIRDAADWLVKSGLAAHGYQYINIDDGWEGARDSKGNIMPNERFADMKELIAYVHAKGLKIGIYSSPGPQTCQRLEGSYQHEAQDAKTWADWGIDYLKYDLCSYNDMLKSTIKDPTAADYRKPYELMHQCLDNQNRDIVYSLCQYGLGSVWQWGDQIGGNSWRTTNDIVDYWGVMSHIGFRQDAISAYAGPGHWNDPDMLVVGKVGINTKGKLHATMLNQNEQVTHITLWSMLCSPLLIGCDLSQLDNFTTDLLSNDEVIAVSQDALAKAGTCLEKTGQLEIWSKKLADGTVAVALFNRSPRPAQMSADWSKLGLEGDQPVRDLWARKDLGDIKQAFTAEVAPHATRLIKVGKAH